MPLARPGLRAKIQRSRLTILALVAVCASVLIEVATLDLGHELTWMGHLSQVQGAWVRYLIFAGTILLIVASFVYRHRHTSTKL
jgi:hypothetical protein